MINAKRVIKSLNWMVPDMKHRHDEIKNNLEDGSQGDYSPQLIEADALLKELKDNPAAVIKDKNVHRQSCVLNCRQFKCQDNNSGKCGLTKITLQAIGGLTLVSHLICANAKEKSKDGKSNERVVQETPTS